MREAEVGVSVKDLCRKHGFSDASFYTWRSKFGGMDVSDAKRLRAMEQENARLKKLLAETMLDKEALNESLYKKTPLMRGFFLVRRAWRVVRKHCSIHCGGESMTWR